MMQSKDKKIRTLSPEEKQRLGQFFLLLYQIDKQNKKEKQEKETELQLNQTDRSVMPL